MAPINADSVTKTYVKNLNVLATIRAGHEISKVKELKCNYNKM